MNTNKVVKSIFGFFLLLVVLVFSASRFGGSGSAPADKPLLLYCAAGVQPALLPLARRYEAACGQRIQIMYGGSGTLLSNLEVSRQGDLFIAADQSYIDLAAGRNLTADVLPLAHMTPVIAVAGGNPKGIRTVEDLMRSDIRLALGNPDAASIGKQTRIILARAGIWEPVKQQVEKNGVFKPTVPDVANDVKLGAVDAGVIWDATAAQYPDLDVVRLPAFDEVSELISVALLKSSRQPAAALRFARYLNSRTGNAEFNKRGFNAVRGNKWVPHPETSN